MSGRGDIEIRALVLSERVSFAIQAQCFLPFKHYGRSLLAELALPIGEDLEAGVVHIVEVAKVNVGGVFRGEAVEGIGQFGQPEKGGSPREVEVVSAKRSAGVDADVEVRPCVDDL